MRGRRPATSRLHLDRHTSLAAHVRRHEVLTFGQVKHVDDACHFLSQNGAQAPHHKLWIGLRFAKQTLIECRRHNVVPTRSLLGSRPPPSENLAAIDWPRLRCAPANRDNGHEPLGLNVNVGIVSRGRTQANGTSHRGKHEMYKTKSVSVVVPCYKEERQIGMVLQTMPDYVDKIVVVDDCSPDNTSGVVEKWSLEDRRIVLIRHEVNQGVGGAIASGYKWARDNDIDIAVVMAGDGQMDPADLPNLLDPIVEDGVNYTKGNRLIWHGSYRLIPKQRFFGNSVLSFLTKVASGYWHVADSQAGYTAADREVLQAIDWDRMYKRYGQPNDLLVRLNVQQFRVRDVPVRPVYGVGEVSGIKIRRVIFTISNVLCKGFLWRMWERYIVRDFHPLVFFYLLGVILMVIGSVLFGRTIAFWFRDGEAPPLSAISMMFCYSTGLQAIFFAMWFDMEMNKHLR
jgi:glycosyltransferase involved in cell wall biosynthesis